MPPSTSSSSSPIGFGIVGSGFMGRTHAEAARRIPGARLIGIAGGSRAEGLADDYDATCFPDFTTLLQHDEIDAVVITTPHWLHCEQALAAADAGKHALVEKPMATSIADCDRMIARFDQQQLTLSVGYHQRFREANWRTRELIQAGEIGAVHCIQTSALFDITTLRSDPGFGGNWSWWTDPRSIAHLMNSGPHNLDLCRWWMDSDVVSVCAECDTFRESNPNENTTMALLRFANNAMATFWSSSVAPQPGFAGEAFRFRIMGERGVIDLDPYDRLQLAKAGDREAQLIYQQPPVNHETADGAFQLPRMQAYCDQLAAVVQSIQGTPGGEGSAVDGKASVAAIVAILESAQRESKIHVETGSP